jgi:hypothetical protein
MERGCRGLCRGVLGREGERVLGVGEVGRWPAVQEVVARGVRVVGRSGRSGTTPWVWSAVWPGRMAGPVGPTGSARSLFSFFLFLSFI